jgi:hypothetical protein
MHGFRPVVIRLASLLALAGVAPAFAQVGTAFTYQGIVRQLGQPVNSTTDLRFSLWSAASAGSQIGSSISRTVSPDGGLVSEALDFGVSAYAPNAPRWLQIEVRNPAGTGLYVPLGSRQALTAVPFSMNTRGVNVDPDGRVGIGTNEPTSLLHLSSQSGLELRMENETTGMMYHVGVAGVDDSFRIAETGVADRLVIAPTTGNVGIGTATPTQKLHVASNSNPQIRLQDLSTGGRQYHMAINSTDDTFRIAESGVGDRITIQAATGNVGIGTTAPTQRLHVASNSNPQIRLQDLSTGGKQYHMSINSTDDTFRIAESGLGDRITIQPATGNVGIGTTTPTSGFKLDVNGNVRCVALTQTSSREFKQGITPLSNALDAVMKLRGVSYEWNAQAPGNAAGTHDIGFIAEEMNEILPDIVAKDEHGKPVGIDYGKVTPVAVEAIKQLKGENDELKARLAALEAAVAKMSGGVK